MHSDAVHMPITTGSAFLIYGWTLQEFVLVLWGVYVAVLIVTKIPELAIALARIRGCVFRRWAKLKGVLKREK